MDSTHAAATETRIFADDLGDCGREPIHLPGAIQPHGCMLLCAIPAWTVEGVSANAGAFLGGDATRLLGQPLDAVLPGKTLHDLRNVLQSSLVSGTAEQLFDVPIDAGDARYDMTLHMTGTRAVVEIVPRRGADTVTGDATLLVKSMIVRLKRAQTSDRFLQLAAQQLRSVTGYDRVMVYRFLENGAGRVVAEALRSDLEPFLGLHYPASDIPSQARALYKKQWLRLIPDVGYEPVPLLSARSDFATEVDLGLASLRSVSPVHLEYLRNMGSAATLTVSIMSGEVLWGLFACHHATPRRIAASTSAAIELFGQVFSLLVESRDKSHEHAYAACARDAHDRLIASMAPDETLFENLPRFSDLLRELIPCDGLGVWSKDRFIGVGTTPPPGRLSELVRFLGEKSATTPYATEALSSLLPAAAGYASEASGVLAVPISRSPRDYLLFFRQELIRTETWGGNPNRPAQLGGDPARIAPRKSFDAWRETVHATAAPWRPAELRIAEALRISLLDVILRRSDLIDRERRAAQETRDILIAELNHRVKNILALIRSLVRQSRQGARTVEGFTHDLEQRIRALAMAHDQLTQTQWNGAPLRALLDAEVRAWTDRADRVTLAGPAVRVEARAYQALALVFHEMMTNAAKYGALSETSGRLAVTWGRDAPGDLRIEWRETGGPPVSPPEHRGFGSVIVEQIVPFELGGEARIAYRREGVLADFTVPAAHVTLAGDEVADSEPPSRPSAAPLAARRLLLVEDSLMIALDAQAMLADEGLAVEVAGTVSDARRLLATESFDAAVLDINLSGERCFDLGDALVELGVPFVFATGYGESVIMPGRFKTVPLVSKPYDMLALKVALAGAAAARSGAVLAEHAP